MGLEPPGTRHEPLRQVGIAAPVAHAIGIGQGAMRHRRPKAQPIELVGTGPQADLDVRQAFATGELREGHGEELIPTWKTTNLVVASIAVDTAAKLFGMNPVGQLRKNQFPSGHNASLAS